MIRIGRQVLALVGLTLSLATPARAVVVTTTDCAETQYVCFAHAVQMVNSGETDTITFSIAGPGPHEITGTPFTFDRFVTIDGGGENIQINCRCQYDYGATLRNLRIIGYQYLSNSVSRVENCDFVNGALVLQDQGIDMTDCTFTYASLLGHSLSTIQRCEFWGRESSPPWIRLGDFNALAGNLYSNIVLDAGNYNQITNSTWLGTVNTITLGGNNLLPGAAGAALTVTGDWNRIAGGQFSSALIASHGNTFTNNLVDSPGVADFCVISGNDNTIAGNRFRSALIGSVHLTGHSNVFRNNLVYSNDFGVYLDGRYNTVQGNWFGLMENAWDLAPIQNAALYIGNTAQHNTIGGYNAGEANHFMSSCGHPMSSYAAIYLAGFTNRIVGNYIGVGPGGWTARGNLGAGIKVGGWATGNEIGGSYSNERNWIVDCGKHGIHLGNLGGSNDFRNNVIGYEPFGTLHGNGWAGAGNHGIYVYMTDGGDFRDNIIAGQTNGCGIYITSGYNLRFQRNRIGTDLSGTNAAAANGAHGIWLQYGTNILLGGAAGVDGNVIVGCASNGAALVLNTADPSIRTEGNSIGLGADGNAAPGNQGIGILLTNCLETVVGSATDGRGNVIVANHVAGLWISGGSSNHVWGNSIGTDTNGAAGRGNGVGVVLYKTRGNRIGGWGAAQRNVISGNLGDGVQLLRGAVTNELLNNLVGVDGQWRPLGNGRHGVFVEGALADEARGNLIGQTNGLLADGPGGNIISGNASNGVMLGWYAGRNHVDGNFIGMVPDGQSTTVANGGDGVYVRSDYQNIGLRAGNAIGGNARSGIYLDGVGWTRVANNRIGVGRLGSTTNSGNGLDGITLNNGAEYNEIGTNLHAAANTIGGNRMYGIYLGPGCNDNDIFGNRIGLGSDSDNVVEPDGLAAIHARDNSGNWIGGLAPELGNVVAGPTGIDLWDATNTYVHNNHVGYYPGWIKRATNMVNGLYLRGAVGTTMGQFDTSNFVGQAANAGVCLDLGARGNSFANLLAGCGTNSTGLPATNTWAGLQFRDARDNTVGSGGRACVFAGSRYGIHFLGSVSNRVFAAQIGAASNWPAARPNNQAGVRFENSMADRLGSTLASYRNFIGGNTGHGVEVVQSTNVVIAGNYIGLDRSGLAANANGGSGIVLFSTHNVQIGGSTTAERNFIGFNGANGLLITNGPHAGLAISGNLVGLGGDAATPAPNSGHGACLNNAANILLGGAAANYFSGNAGYGVLITGPLATNNAVTANLIGGPAPNALGGVGIVDAPANQVTANVIAGNYRNGVRVANSSGDHVAMNNRIENNLIGCDTQTAIPNAENGVVFDNATFTYAIGNVICGNGSNGVAVLDQRSHDNFIQGNYIGWHPTATAAMPNAYSGVLLFGGDANRVGGTNSWEANVIAHQYLGGVWVARGIGNRVWGNSMYSNLAWGIRLGTNTTAYPTEQDGVPNRSQRAPWLTNATLGSLSISGLLQSRPAATYMLEFFLSDSNSLAAPGQGKYPLGRTTVTTDGAGLAPVAVLFDSGAALLAAPGMIVTATATDANGNTSAFSDPLYVGGQPPSPDCSYAVSPATTNIAAAGGSGTITLVTGESCAWSAHAAAGWVTLAATNGTGPAAIGFSVAANAGYTARTTAVLVATGRVSIVQQPAAPPPGTGAVSAVVFPADAINDGAQWRLTTDANTNWQASGASLTIDTGWYTLEFKPLSGWQQPAGPSVAVFAGATTVVTGIYACAATISPDHFTFPAAGGTGTVTVALGSGCPWSAAVSSGGHWLTFLTATNGTGPGAFAFVAAAMTNAGARSGSILVNDSLTITIDQQNLAGRPGLGWLLLLIE